MTAPPEIEVAVLIVGGGPVGLTASLLLSDLGVDSLLVERNQTTSDHPKAHVINTRTMEIFRSLKVADGVRAEAVDDRAMLKVRWVRSLKGAELALLDNGPDIHLPSPTRMVSCPQDRVEAVLAEAANGRRGVVRFGTEVTSLDVDHSGVTATLADGTSVRALYVIAADGAGSGIRRQLEIPMDGLPELATLVGTYFHADLRAIFAERPALLYWVMNGEAPGTFITLDGADRWMFHTRSLANGAMPTDSDVAALIRTAIGDPGIAIDVKSVRPWRMTAQIADRYRHGAVFLAGDAAHRFPPTGGLGLNTGVQDVHNLAWKLARVLAGDSSDALLDTYELERRPVAQANCDFSVHNAMAGGTAVGPGMPAAIAALDADGPDVPDVIAQLRADVEANRAHFGSPGLDLGFVYTNGALVSDGQPPSLVTPGSYTPTARPGARAPHVWLDLTDGRVSTLDLVGRDFVLLVAGPVDEWHTESAAEVAPGEPFGLEAGGALLVRPDGHVAWRSITRPEHPADRLAGVRRELECC